MKCTCSRLCQVTTVRFASVTRVAWHTEAVAVANELHAVLVDPHQTDRVDVWQDAAVESTGSNLTGHNQFYSDSNSTFTVEQLQAMSDLSIQVGNATVALGRSIKLADLCDLKTLREGLPHAGA